MHGGLTSLDGEMCPPILALRRFIRSAIPFSSLIFHISGSGYTIANTDAVGRETATLQKDLQVFQVEAFLKGIHLMH